MKKKIKEVDVNMNKKTTFWKAFLTLKDVYLLNICLVFTYIGFSNKKRCCFAKLSVFFFNNLFIVHPLISLPPRRSACEQKAEVVFEAK